MKKRNGFVLIETLVVVLLLTVTLMSLYATFSYIVDKTKERNNSDSIETLYKTYYVKDLLDTYESSHVNETEKFRDSFIYYITKLNLTTGTNPICTSYGYDDGNSGHSIDSVQDQMVICDYSFYNGGTNSDPIYEAVSTYNIQKIYYMNFNYLNASDYRTDLMNKLDASSIDYVLSQPDTDAYYMVIKYSKDYNYPSDYDINANLKIYTEAFHSSIAMNEVEAGDSSAPIYYCADAGCTVNTSSGSQFKNNEKVTLTSAVSFTHTSGLSIVGWCSSGQVFNSDFDFDSHVSSTSNGTNTDGIECYKVGTEMTVSSKNRHLYAKWCGDGSLKGMLECSAVSNSSPTTSGLYNSNGVYRYYGSVANNYVVVGDYCFRLISNFQSGNDYIKAIYAGGAASSGTTCGSNSLIWGYSTYSYSKHDSGVSVENYNLNSGALTYNNNADSYYGTINLKTYSASATFGGSKCGSSIKYENNRYSFTSTTLNDVDSNWNTTNRYLIKNNDSSKVYYLVTKDDNMIYYVTFSNNITNEYEFYYNFLNNSSARKYGSSIYNVVFKDSNSSSFAYLMKQGQYASLISKAKYCNDYSLYIDSYDQTKSSFGASAGLKYSGNQSDFLIYNTSQRYYNNDPQLTCQTAFSYESYAGLLSIDEALYAGVNVSTSNYLRSNYYSYWLMSPASKDKIFIIDNTGKVSTSRGASTSWDNKTEKNKLALGVRPVVAIKLNDNFLCGTGSSSTPYVIGDVSTSAGQNEKSTYCD